MTFPIDPIFNGITGIVDQVSDSYRSAVPCIQNLRSWRRVELELKDRTCNPKQKPTERLFVYVPAGVTNYAYYCGLVFAWIKQQGMD